ncbi:MAG: ORF6N domain-containing protein [Deltaproteobacteria bacterium]|nr:ORF6N domain-containing protein [Deltaproteobacteria bacterium]
MRGDQLSCQRRLTRAIKANRIAFPRNLFRCPPDFIFQLTNQEKAEVVANCDHLLRLKFSPVLPYAFTEHGAIMAASVLNSERAIQVSLSSADFKGYQALNGASGKADQGNWFPDTGKAHIICEKLKSMSYHHSLDALRLGERCEY